jgi:hypothetical protein
MHYVDPLIYALYYVALKRHLPHQQTVVVPVIFAVTWHMFVVNVVS